MIKLLMIADDFTGALDTGVQFASYGANTRVVTGPEVDLAAIALGVEVLAVDAETRHLSAQEAYEVVSGIVEQARELGVPYIYKKTDSALRGNVGAELTALLEKSGRSQLVFLPAFPQIGRTTVGGVHRIKGVPVAESVFGQDPFEPVRHSRVTEVIAEQSAAAVHSCPALKAGESIPEQEGIMVFDAETPEELRSTGQRLLEADRLHIMAGCAGFGTMLPGLLGYQKREGEVLPELDPRLLMVCGSVNPITVEQMALAEENGFHHIRLSPEQKLAPDYWDTPLGKKTLEQMENSLKREPYCIIDVNDEDGNDRMEKYARERSIGLDELRVRIARSVGAIVGNLFTSPAVGTMLITGGDTLLHCMQYMGVREVEPICEMATGVVLSRFTWDGCTRYVLSKSGGFGQRSLVVDLARKLSGEGSSYRGKAVL